MKKVILGIFLLSISLFCLFLFYKSNVSNIVEKAYVQKKNSNIIVFDGSIEPDIPNVEQNDKGLLGVDSNRNGIRDDIEIWINRSFEKYNERMVLKQYANDIYNKLITAEKDDSQLMSFSSSSIFTTSACISFIFGFEKGNEVMKIIDELMINTYSRKSVVKNFNRHIYTIETIVPDMKVTEPYKGCGFILEDEVKLKKDFAERYKLTPSL